MSNLIDLLESTGGMIAGASPGSPAGNTVISRLDEIFWNVYNATELDKFFDMNEEFGIDRERVTNICRALSLCQFIHRPHIGNLDHIHVASFILTAMRVGWDLCEESFLKTMEGIDDGRDGSNPKD